MTDLMQEYTIVRQRVDKLRKQIAEYWQQRQHIANRINRTHKATRINDKGDCMVMKLNLDAEACKLRQPLFPMLDDLYIKYSPLINEQRYMKAYLKILAKQVEQILRKQNEAANIRH